MFSVSQGGRGSVIFRFVTSFWLVFNLVFSSLGVVWAGSADSLSSTALSSSLSAGSADFGLWGKISPVSFAPLPASSSDPSSLHLVSDSSVFVLVALMLILSFSLVSVLSAFPFRAGVPAAFVLSLFALPALAALLSSGVSAADNFGCCVHPVSSSNMYVCLNTQLSACCGMDSSAEGYDLCNATFVEGNVNCFDTETPVPACLNGYGCCVYEGDSCADTQYKAQCYSDKYYPNTDCSDVSQCDQICCVWSNGSSNYCDFVPRTKCEVLDESPSFPSSYVGSYSYRSAIDSVSSASACQQECSSFDVRPSNITGFVTDSSGFPLENVSVSNGEKSVLTDSSGHYEIINSYSGSVFLEVSKTGYSSVTRSIQVPAGSVVEENFTLSYSGYGAVDGKVFIAGTSIPVSNATVVLAGFDWSFEDTFLSTDSDGYFSFDNVPAGHSYKLTAYLLENDDYSPSTSNEFPVDEGALVSWDLAISYVGSSFSISGFVLNKSGSFAWPGRAFNVTAARSEGGYFSVSANSTTGAYNISGLMKGTYYVYVPQENLSSDESSSMPVVDLASNAEVNVTVVNKSEMGGYTSYTCSDIGGVACCLSYLCPSSPADASLGYSSDCGYDYGEICCAVQCMQSDKDSDGDGTPDANEPRCKFIPEYTDETRLSNESVDDGTCSDGIDNDCDGKIDNNDDDCQICPVEYGGCNYSANSSCNETASQLAGSQVWDSYNLADPAQKSEYCSLCPEDSDCEDSCAAKGGVCCSTGCAGSELTAYSSSCPEGQACCNESSVPPGEPVCASPPENLVCVKYRWQCSLLLNMQYPGEYPSCPSDAPYACDDSFEIKDIPSCIIGEPFNSSKNIFTYNNYHDFNASREWDFSNNTACLCGNADFNTSWNGTAVDYSHASPGYCCPDGPSSEACPPPPGEGRYNISVYDVNTSISNCRYLSTSCLFYTGTDYSVHFYSGPVELYSFDCSPGVGRCDGLVPAGTYNVSVQAPDRVYDSWESNDELKNLVVIEDPNAEASAKAWLRYGFDCNSETPPPPEDMRLDNVMGTTNFTLFWKMPVCSNLQEVRIFKSNENEDSGSDLIFIGSNYNDYCSSSFTDPVTQRHYYNCTFEDVANATTKIPNEWGTVYNYTVVLVYHVDSELYSSNASFSKSTGEEVCKGITNNSFEFCLDANEQLLGPDFVLQAKCDSHNNHYLLKNCSADGTDMLCIGPDYNHKTFCVNSVSCSFTSALNSSSVGNPYALGVFVNRSACMNSADGDRKYCYLDYSDSVTDACFNCSQQKTCFDYVSKDACLQDNCLAAGNPQSMQLPPGNCSWLETWPEFGRGICYRENYTGTDYCGLCNMSSNGIFVNPVCTQEVCSKLGKCFSGLNGHACVSCDSGISCSDYHEKDSCIGAGSSASNFSLVKDRTRACVSSYSFSGDSCSVGLCKWNDSSGTCFKDANDNDKQDCVPKRRGGDLLSVGSADSCRSDKEPPVSSVSAPLTLNSKGARINFSVIDDNYISKRGYSMVYWSLNNTSSCPSKFFNSSADADSSVINYIILPDDWNTLNKGLIPQGDVTLYYYAVDMFGFPEVTRSVSIQIDTVPPSVPDFSYSVVNSTYDDTKSHLIVSFNTSEPANCSASFLGGVRTGPGVEPGMTIQHSGRWENLSDFAYTLTLRCTDSFGNTNDTVKTVVVARMGEIFGLVPDIDAGSSEEERLDNIFNRSDNIYFEAWTPFEWGDNSEVQCDVYNDSITWKDISDVEVGCDPLPWLSCIYQNDLQPYILFTMDASPSDPSLPGIKHSKLYSFSGSGSHELVLVCYNKSDVTPKTSVFRFSIDTESPSTVLQYRDGHGVWRNYSGASYSSELLLRFHCMDNVQPGTNYSVLPNEAGCANVTYCVADSDVGVCSLETDGIVVNSDEQFAFSEEGKTLIWTSEDKVGNRQAPPPSEQQILIDTEPPQLSVTFPDSDVFVTGSPSVWINGSWSDNTGLSKIEIVRNSSVVSNALISSGTFASGNSTDAFPVDLVEGLNDFYVEGYDLAKNAADDSVRVYYDTVAPVLGKFEISSQGVDVKEKNFAEYGMPVNISFTVNDEQYTALSEQQNTVEILLVKNNSVFNSSTVVLPAGETDGFYEIVPQLNASGDYDLPVGNYTVRLNYYDRFGNAPASFTSSWFEVRDTSRPELSVNITDASPVYPGWLIETGRNYTVMINSSEPLLDDFLNLSFSWSGSPKCRNVPPHYLKNITMIDSTRFSALLFLPDPVDDSCLQDVDSGVVSFRAVDTFDRNGNPVSNPLSTVMEYKIDTKSAGTVQFVYPGKNDETVFVNDAGSGAGFLTGYSDSEKSTNRSVTVRMVKRDEPIPDYELDIFSGWNASSSAVSAPEHHDLGFLASVVSFNASAGSSWVVIDNNQYTPGRGVSFSGHTRKTEAFYNITSASSFGSYWNITVSPPLEQNVSVGESVTLYNETVPGGWFSVNIPLDEGEGSYYFYAYGTDEHGLESTSPGVLRIIYDNSAPVLDDARPYDNSISPDLDVNISFHAADSLSGFALDKVRISITTADQSLPHNGTFSCSDSVVKCLDADGNPASDGVTDMTVIYDNAPLNYTEYNVSAYVEDLAGNNASLDWFFELRSDYPAEPVMVLDAGYPFESVSGEEEWFVPVQTFTGNLSFEQDEEVNITGMDMITQPGAEPSYARTSSNSFDLDFSTALEERSHILSMEAIKKINQTDWNGGPIPPKYVTVDLTKPSLSIDNVKTRPAGYQESSLFITDLDSSAEINKSGSDSGFSYSLLDSFTEGTATTYDVTRPDDFVSWFNLTAFRSSNDGTVTVQYSLNSFTWTNLSSPVYSDSTAETYDISSLPEHVYLRVVLSRESPSNASPVFYNFSLSYNASVSESFLATSSSSPVLSGNFSDENLDGSDNGRYASANRIFVNYSDSHADPQNRTFDASIKDNTWSAQLDLYAYPAEKEIPVSFTACDKAGNCFTNGSLVLVYDEVPPPPVQISSSLPAEHWVKSESAEFNWTIPDDFAGIEVFWLYLDSSEISETLRGTQNRYTWSDISTGKHSFGVRPVDFAANEGPVSSYDVWIDNSPPEISGIVVSPDRTNSVFFVNATITDRGEGKVTDVTLLVNGSPDYCYVYDVVDSLFTFRCDVSSLAGLDEDVPLNVTARDYTVGNVGYAESSVRIDSSSPVITSLSHVPETGADFVEISLTTDEPAFCSWSTTDQDYSYMNPIDEDVASESHSINITLSQDGTYTFYFRCSDDLGNAMQSSNSTSVVRDTTPPPLYDVGFGPVAYRSSSPETHYVSDPSFFVWGTSEQLARINIFRGTEVVASSIINDSASPVVFIRSNGLFDENNERISYLEVPINTTLRFENELSTDALVTSNVSGMESVSVAPSGSYEHALSDLGFYYVEVTTEIGTDTYIIGSFDLRVREIDNTFNLSVPLLEGMQFIRVDAYDSLNNTNSSETYAVYNDSSSPLVTPVDPADGDSTNDFRKQIQFDVEDDGSGVAWNSFNMTVELLTPGTLYSCTYADGCTNGASVDYSAAPRIIFTGPDGWLNSSVLYYSPVNVSVNVRDNAGLWTSRSWSFTLDNDTPSDPVIYVADESCDSCSVIYTSSADPQLRVEFAEDVSILSAFLNSDDVASSMYSSDNRTWFLDTRASSGSFDFSVEAIKIDASGREVGRSGTFSQSYVVDTSPPADLVVYDVQAVNDGKIVEGSMPEWRTTDSQVKLYINWSEDYPDTLLISGGVAEQVSSDVSSYADGIALEINLSAGDGLKQIYVELTDRAGLSNSTQINITLDTSAPNAPELFDPGWVATNKPSVKLAGWASADTDHVVVTVANVSGVTYTALVPSSSISSGEEEVGTYSLYEASAGYNVVRISGDHCGELNNTWVQFSSSYSLDEPRYRVTECSTIYGGAASEVTLDRDAPAMSEGAVMYAYTTEYPDGYFFVTINLEDGENLVRVFAYDDLGNEVEGNQLRLERDDSLSLSASIIEPDDGVVNQADFGSGSYRVVVQTNYDAECFFTHEADIVAQRFTQKMSGSGTTQHTLTFDSSQCAENGGTYCMIGGTYYYQRYYDHFTITCSAVDYDVDDVSLGSCLTIATYTSTQGSEQGVNVCQNSAGMCGTSTLNPTTTCADCSNFDNDQSSCEANNCMWCSGTDSCVSSCSDSSCASEPLDYGDDRVCDASCDSYSSQSDCTSTNFCSWCSSSNSCVSSCSDCSDPYEYTGDFVCDASCDTYSTESDCAATNFCRWCPSNGGSCVSSCSSGTCGDYPSDYGNDEVCDLPCDTYSGDQSSCEGTGYCMWCSGTDSCVSSCSTGCADDPNNFNDGDRVCDPPCQSFGSEYYSCVSTGYCMWCPSSFSCGEDCASCSDYTADYGNDNECDQPSSGNNYGFLT